MRAALVCTRRVSLALAAVDQPDKSRKWREGQGGRVVWPALPKALPGFAVLQVYYCHYSPCLALRLAAAAKRGKITSPSPVAQSEIRARQDTKVETSTQSCLCQAEKADSLICISPAKLLCPRLCHFASYENTSQRQVARCFCTSRPVRDGVAARRKDAVDVQRAGIISKSARTWRGGTRRPRKSAKSSQGGAKSRIPADPRPARHHAPPPPVFARVEHRTEPGWCGSSRLPVPNERTAPPRTRR